MRIINLFTFALVVHSWPAGAGHQALCERVLGTLQTVKCDGREQPVHKFFVTFDQIRVRASLGLFSGSLGDYGGAKSLILPPDGTPGVTQDRLASAQAFRKLFTKAALEGEDHALARTLLSIDRISHGIGDALACSGFVNHLTHPNESKLMATLRARGRSVIDRELEQVQSNWAKLSPSNRRTFVEWIGRELVEGLSRKRIARIDLTLLDRHDQPIPQLLPAFPKAKQGLDDYLAKQSTGPRQDRQKLNYYREIGAHLMTLFGIDDGHSRSADAFTRLVNSLVNGHPLLDFAPSQRTETP